jgi:hypothetical protein
MAKTERVIAGIFFFCCTALVMVPSLLGMIVDRL